MPKLLVALTGMPGSGKSTIAQGLKHKGYQIINMGDAVRAECKRRNVEPSGENLGQIMLELREKHGMSAIAKLIQPDIQDSTFDVIIIDGIRSNEEIQELKKTHPLRMLSVHASTDTRFTFLSKRGRSDDPDTRDNFDQRDTRELGVGISKPIALSDESISNNNLSIEQLITKADEIIKFWIQS